MMLSVVKSIALVGAFFSAAALPTLARDLTLKDFNTPSERTLIREALGSAGIGIEEMSLILVANDDCDLGWTDEQLEAIIWNVNFMRSLMTPEGGKTPVAFDAVAMSEQWTAEYSRGNRVAKMALCDPLKRASEAAQARL